ncbi:tetratricopeptide repeat protein [Myxococcota bacterium]|nr:tetratricopeptide repeat protein [Myxococcota bacterium]
MMMKRALLIALISVSFAVPQLADTPQAMAKKASKKAKKAKKAKKKSAEAEAQKAAERKTAAKFDWTSMDAERVDMDERADVKRDEAITKLKKLLPTIPDGDQKAGLIFRLSEMFWAKSKFLKLTAMHMWDQSLEVWVAEGRKGKEPKIEKINEYDQAELYKREALKLYGKILAKYPRYERNDEVLYNLGSSLYESGKKKDGVKRYWTLIKQYPKSRFAPDAWLQLGEHFFNNNKLTQAIKAYTKAAETRKPRIYSYAIYKLAWCDYNMQEYDQSLVKFREVIEYAKKQKGEKKNEGDMASRDRIQLTEEALADMVRVYSHLDAFEDAFDYYNKEVGKDKSYRYLHKLAGLYNTEGKHAIEIRTYRELNKRYPYASQAPSNQTAIMNAYAQLNKTDNVRNEVRRLVDLYSPNGIWAQKNKENKAILAEAFEVVEQELAALVTEKHREAQSTKLVETYKLARDIYGEYLAKFSNTINSYKFRFFYAEILFELKEFDKAAEQYAKVVQEKADGEFVKPAAYTTILALEKVLNGVEEKLGKKITEGKRGKSRGALRKLEQIRKLKKGQSYDPTELTKGEKALADACDLFVSVAGKDDEVVKVKFKSARLYFIHNQFEEAATRFGEIIDRWPKDKLARMGAESILESFNVRKDWTNLNQWSRKFKDHKLLMADKSFSKKVFEFVEGSSFNEIHKVYEPKGDTKDIADRYWAFVNEFPDSKFAMVGLFNAIINYDKSNLLEKSIEGADRMLKKYATFKIKKADVEKSKREGGKLPNPDEIREKTTFLAASFRERLAEFDKAAKCYERYIKDYKKGPKRSDALFNAGILRDGLGHYDDAISNFNAYIKEFPKKKDVIDIYWRIGLIYERKGDYRSAQRQFEGFAKIAKKDEARIFCSQYKVLEALAKQKRTKEVFAAYDSILKNYAKLSAKSKKASCSLDAVGEAAFVKVQASYDEYMGIKLEGSDKVIEENLIKKLGMVDSLQKSYTQVLSIGQGDYGIASLYRIGRVYQVMAEDIFNVPCPRKLDMDQCDIYQAALQEKAFPLEEKAIEAFDKALGKAYELGLYNDWLAKAQEAMKTYEPMRFPEIHKNELIASEKLFELPVLVEAAK